MIDAETLRGLLDYNTETGVFRWRINRRRLVAGSVAGSPVNGYVRVFLDRQYYAHRLAWLWVHGVWPRHNIDHIDGDGLNNRLTNLREATQSQNNANARKRRAAQTTLKGVSLWRGRQYRAYIKTDGKSVYLGTFATEQEAHDAYCKAARQAYGAFFRAI